MSVGEAQAPNAIPIAAAAAVIVESMWMLFSLVMAVSPQETEDHAKLDLACPSGPVASMHYGDDVRVPYLWPVRGPGGIEMTRAFPMETDRPGEAHDHPHHASMWFAHGDVDGHDFWHGTGRFPRIDVIGKPKVETTEERTVVTSEHAWRATEDDEVLREARKLTITEDETRRVLDFELTLTATRDVRFGDTKEGSFAIRVRPELRLKGEVAVGHARDSEGRNDRELWGKRSRWLLYHGVAEERRVGIAVYDHPKNLRHPTWWHARDYGLVAANPFGIHDFERKPKGTGDHDLKKGEALRMRYRVVLFAGEPDFAAVESDWRAWAGVREGQSSSDGPGKAGDDDGRDS